MPVASKLNSKMTKCVDKVENDRANTVLKRQSANPLMVMLNRKRIDEAQFLAAMKYQAAHLISSGQTGRGIDYSYQRVDGRYAPMTLTEKQINAQDIIRNANRCLEQRYDEKQYGEKELSKAKIRLQKIAGEGLSVTQYAKIVLRTQNSNYITREMKQFRDDLEHLAEFWCLLK